MSSLASRRIFMGLVSAAAFIICSSHLQEAAAEDVDFGKQIWPLLERSCLKCHKAPYEKPNGRIAKPKAGLRIDTTEFLMRGALDDDDNYKPVIVAGKPDESSFYKLVTLDPEDDDVMPSKGDPLTKAEQELLKNWILQGAKFGGFKPPKGK